MDDKKQHLGDRPELSALEKRRWVWYLQLKNSAGKNVSLSNSGISV
jgi:hypothetical protein